MPQQRVELHQKESFPGLPTDRDLPARDTIAKLSDVTRRSNGSSTSTYRPLKVISTLRAGGIENRLLPFPTRGRPRLVRVRSETSGRCRRSLRLGAGSGCRWKCAGDRG